ncbi:GNAT family N-acetyltransferase [Streptomyces sp. TS71-3]|uniref:GNAT family N-acetyltransferase n=1 Tax=Streptomyces sp. TS71-3 TaxID=2733862 RepID=UPI001B041D06|nr:GNAT family N-acetyltransferase [Streptomyces sp. TS71-3]GHJ38141.1 N-acetyltransferase [Streptomyces sp. TS71-3]
MVTLRPLTLDDAPAVQRICCGASVRYAHGYDFTPEQARATIGRIINLTPATGWGFGIDAAGDLVGLIKARRRTPATAAVSYILRDDTWGNGYATAAVRQLTPILFAAGVNVIEAKHHPDNPASGRVLANAGFIRIGSADFADSTGAVVAYTMYELRRRERPRTATCWSPHSAATPDSSGSWPTTRTNRWGHPPTGE